ncbi:MAG: choice-of-anchor J domain-containing protein, partial [Bacteroidia bacterium]|nr:choice-of-anchor J domain-containing protein [Bacteroidia bacterium]
MNTLQVGFWMRKGNNTSNLMVGVMSDLSDPTSFVGIDTVSPSATTVWEPFEVSLASYTGQGRYIAFKAEYNSTTNYLYLDDVVVDYIPACARPTNIAFANITTTSADVSWTPGNSTDNAWWIYYKAAGTSNWDSVYSVTNSYSFTTLSPMTTYEIEIRTDCGTELSEPSFVKTFMTSCSLITSLPYTESFDYYGTGTDIFLPCWGRKTTYSYYPYVNSTSNTAPGSLYFYTNSGNYNIGILPGLDPSINVSDLSMYFKLRKGSAAYNLTIGVMSDTAIVSTFDSIANFSPSATSSWENFSVDFASYTGTGQYIAFRCDGYGGYNGMFVDDLVLMTTPSCNIPTGLTRLASTTNSMTFDWDSIDDANCLGWLIDYKLYEDENWQSEFAATHPHTLSNLNPNNVYNIRLRAICTSGDTTFHSNVLNYGMPCEPISIFPWEEGFEDSWWVGDGLGGTADSRPWCWININGGTQANGVWRKTTSSSYVRTGTGALQMYSGSTSAGDCNDWFITPVMTLTGNERLQFWAKGYSSYTDELNIQIFDVTTNGAMTSAADTSLFTVVMPDVIVPASDWTPYEVSLTQFIGDYQIAFVRNTTGGYYLNIDDISVSPMPQCAGPSAVSFSNITANSADVNWIPANTTDFAWWVYYRATGTTTWDSIYAITYPVNITNLTGDTEYEVEIRTDCGYQLSPPSFTMTFTTACAPISTFPHLESFDTYGTGTSVYPSCWQKINTYSSDRPYISTTNYSAPGSMYFYASSGTFNIGSVELAPWVGIDSLRMKLQLRVGVTASKCIVGVMSDANDATTFVGVDTLSMSALSTWQEFEIFFTNYTGTGKHIAFKSEYATDYNSFYIDDLVIDYIPACAKPLYLNVSNTTATSTDISWTPGNQNSNSWWLYWRNKMTNVLDSAYVSGMTTHNIINLNPSTEYEYYLKTDCLTEFSEISSVMSFTTPCLPISTFPYTENFDTYGGATSDLYPNCWMKITTYSTYPYLNSTNYSPPASLYFYATTGNYNIAILPAIDPSVGMDSLMVSFYLRNGSATSVAEVGVMDDVNDPSTFTPIATLASSTTTTFEKFDVFLAAYTGTGRYIAFRSLYTTATNYFRIDDLVIDYIPTCPKPVNQVANNITTNSAEISWTSTSQATTSWWLYWKETTASNFDSVLVTNDTLYNLSNLN